MYKIEIKRKPAGSESEFTEDRGSSDAGGESGRFRKERRKSLVFAWGLYFLLRTVVWYMCPLRHPGKGQNKD